MSLATPDAVVKSIVFGYIYDDDGTTPIQNAKVKFTSPPFMRSDNLIAINEEVLSDAAGRYQANLPTTRLGDVVLSLVVVDIRWVDSAGASKSQRETIVVPETGPTSVQSSRATFQDVGVIFSGPQGPQGPQGLTGAPGTLADLTVTDAANPTELNAEDNVSQGEFLIARQAVAAGLDVATLYMYDSDNATAASAPYIMTTSAGGNTRWIAVTGRYTIYTLQNLAGDRLILATEITKLAGIETAADVTDVTNVVAALDVAGLTGVTVAASDLVLIKDVSDTNKLKTVTAQAIADLAPPTKEMFFSFSADTNSYNGYGTRNAGATAAVNFATFKIPHDFTSLVALEVVCIPNANVVSGDIDLISTYAAVGEDSQTHSESDLTTTYNLTADEMTAIDISGVFTSLSPNDYCGIQLDHNAIGTTISYLGIRLRYT